MLKSSLLQPQILEALGRAGHSSKILIADGNYPASTRLGPNARLVSMNLMPGVITCTQALEALLSAVPIEAAAGMQYATTGPYALKEDPPIWSDFRRLLAASSSGVELTTIERFAFYDAAGAPDVALTIQTADQRIYANLLLTIGVVKPG
jgi:L-fucose mutarotase